MELYINYHGNDPIEKIDEGDWIDLRSAEDVNLEKGHFYKISLGVSMKLPEGYEAHVVPRSSTFQKWGIIQTNGVGIIDNSYSGDDDIWMMPVLATRDSFIYKGDRICQFRIVKKQPAELELIAVDHLDGPNRGGFGSTDSNH